MASPDPARGFAEFHRLVVQDAALHAQLQNALTPDAFVALTTAAGAARGFAFGAEDVRAALQAARHGAGQEPTLDAAHLAGWTPINMRWQNAGLTVDWCRLGELRFTDPFFEDTIARALRDPARRLFRQQTPVATLEHLPAVRPGLPPTGFIFHLSRCGSTLLAQMLAALERNIVISEAPPLDEILRAHLRDPRITRAQRIAWFRGLVSAYAQPRGGGESQVFIKFDSWHTLELPLIAEAFPDVPWIFLYRDPVEVLVSHHRLRGTQMIPGVIDPRFFGLEPAAAAAMPFDEYGARVLARIAEAALTHARTGHARLVNFRQLPAVLWESLGEFFRVDWSPADLAHMRAAAQFDAKNPTVTHQDDSAAKQLAASGELRRLAEGWLAGIHRQLEQLRLAPPAQPAAAPAARAASARSSARSQSFTSQSITR